MYRDSPASPFLSILYEHSQISMKKARSFGNMTETGETGTLTRGSSRQVSGIRGSMRGWFSKSTRGSVTGAKGVGMTETTGSGKTVSTEPLADSDSGTQIEVIHEEDEKENGARNESL